MNPFALGHDEGPDGYRLQYRIPEMRPAFAALYRKMLAEQWSVDDGSIDWAAKPHVEGVGFVKSDLVELRAHFVANALIAEEFAFRGIGKRLDHLEQADEKLCFAVIIADEHRHALALSRYQRLLGEFRDPDIRMVEEMTRDDEFDVEGVAILSLVGESLLAHALPSVWRFTRDPLLRALLPRMKQDELRHVEFSQIYLRSRAPGWSASRRRFLTDVAAHAFAAHHEFCFDPDPVLLGKLSPMAAWATRRISAGLFQRVHKALLPEFTRLGLRLPGPSEERPANVSQNLLPSRFDAPPRLGLPD